MEQIGRQLVAWYGANARDLPWRQNPTPYRVWVSEIMLQQTSVTTVLEYYARWLTRFPNVASLAAASEQEVLSLWEGLGYYQRARRMLAAARMLVDEFDGKLPTSRAALLKLPGVGPYVANAILSMAFGRDVVALDANVIRVFMRLLAMEGTGAEKDVRKAVEHWALVGLPAGRSAEYNQGWMDFGSSTCRPRRPLCGECFLQEDCDGFRKGTQYDIPRPSSRRLQRIETAVALFLCDSCVYLQKRPPGGLFAGMWEFPGGKVKEGESAAEAVVRECREELGVDCRVRRELVSLVHYYTVFEVTLHAFLSDLPEGLPVDAEHRWVTMDEVGDYPMPSANRQVVEALADVVERQGDSD